MNLSVDKKATEIASLTAKEAGKKIKPFFGKVSVVREKEDPTDLCSEADLLAEKIIFSRLNREFPQFNYLSEGKEYLDRSSEYTWVIDPLDGSIPFIAGLDYWGVSIGLLKKDKPLSGVIYIPLGGSGSTTSRDWAVSAMPRFIWMLTTTRIWRKLTLRVLLKSLNGYEANFDSGRIKLILK